MPGFILSHDGIAGHRPAKAEALRPKIVQGEGWGCRRQ